VLHVPYTYFPDPCGGTEVYVHGLVRGLSQLGYECHVAAPGRQERRYEYDGIEVHRFQTDPAGSLEQAYGAPDEVAAESFQKIAETVRPDVVHLHARTSAISERIVDIAHAAGAKVVLTYHTPTVSCARGTMMLFGKVPCDGIIERSRCSACVLSARGLPIAAAKLAIAAPGWLVSLSKPAARRVKALKALQVPSLIEEMHGRLRRLLSKVDHVVAVCQWVREVLGRNGVPSDKMTLSRQAITQAASAPPRVVREPGRPLSIAYFGRVDHAKGPDLLARALRLVPGAAVEIDIYAVRQPGSERDIGFLEASARNDARLRVLPAVPAGQVIETMAKYDFIAVPSRGLETGPLVVLEAFAAGVPVLGARLGGIAELVRDGRDGVLVAPDDPNAWAECLARLLDRRELTRLRQQIKPPRRMKDAAVDMAALYSALLVHRSVDPAVVA
jgi:glycosyltransferase involved in cell wall biosynthesis